jgi:hypothetical protein
MLRLPRFIRLRRALLRWRLNLVHAEIQATLVERKEAQVEGDITFELQLESYLASLNNEYRLLAFRLAKLPQPT